MVRPMADGSGEPAPAGHAGLSTGSTDGDAIQRRERAKETFISNCWMWAIWRFMTKGGVLIFSKSEWGWWPHFMWSPDLSKCVQFEPDHKRRHGRLWPPFIYRGYLKETRL